MRRRGVFAALAAGIGSVLAGRDDVPHEPPYQLVAKARRMYVLVY